MSDKIKPIHLERSGYVYVRQSTLHQVRSHREGQRRQYGLRARAEELGFRQVIVIDDDLGISGAGSHHRPGFARLLAAVCEGLAGAVLALEASRLARNNRDWYHLIDLCVLTETLVIDYEGVCDPRLMNDRLLLGLKGTMSEFELALLRQRAQEALHQKILRGEVLTEVPVGYARTEDNGVEMMPDRQVQEAIRGVFARFRELGSARQVLLWYRQEGIRLPVDQRKRAGEEVRWAMPVYNRILSILKNPIYAGAFAYGRTRARTVILDGRARKTAGHAVDQREWDVLIQDHHPAYISWEEYLRNQKQLAENAAMRGAMTPGPAKTGPALLAGLLRCARCGRKLHVGYSGIGGRVPRHFCRGGSINHGTAQCISFGGLRVDRAVASVLLETLRPVGVEAALEAWGNVSEEKDEKRKALELAVEKARYEVHRSRRQYDAVDPDNRLVAAELETRWNAALQRQAETEERLQAVAVRDEPIREREKARLLGLGRDLETVWNHPDAAAPLKKRVLRTAMEEVVVDLDEDRSEIILRIHWAGGVHTRLAVPKNRTGRHGRATDKAVVDLVRDLAKVCHDSAITAILNRLGYRTGAGNRWTQPRVASLRSYYRIPTFDRTENRPWITLGEAAVILEVSRNVARRLIRDGVLPARQVVAHAPWVIQREHLKLPRIVRAVQAVHEGRRLPRTVPGQGVIPFQATT